MWRRALAPLLLSAALSGAASAQAPDGGSDGDEPVGEGKRPLLKLHGDATHNEADAPEAPNDGAPVARGGSYRGVAPGLPNLPPRAPRLPTQGPTKMTWPGFQVRDGVPTVFLELTGAVEWSVTDEPGRLVYTLRATTIPVRNNRRPLKVREFGTVVSEVDTRARGKDVQVTIRLRAKSAHAEHLEDAAGGFKLLVIELKS